MEPMETVIVVVLSSIIVLGTFASAWYFTKNLRHFREEVGRAADREREARLRAAEAKADEQGGSEQR